MQISIRIIKYLILWFSNYSLSIFLSPLVNSTLIPKIVLEEFVKFILNLEHDVQLLLLEFKSCIKLSWVVWETNSILEVNVIEPFLEVVLEEAE